MALAWYQLKLTKHPLATKCVTSGVLGFIGDQICQTVQDPQLTKPRDWRRSGVFGLVGLCYIGPMLHTNFSRVLPYLVPECAKTPQW